MMLVYQSLFQIRLLKVGLGPKQVDVALGEAALVW
jgi:hypothetical protein